MSINVLASTIVIASISYAQPSFQTQYVQPVAQISYVEAAAQISYLEVQVTVELSVSDQIVIEVVTPTDLISLGVNKGFSDATSGLTDNSTRSFGKRPIDQLFSSDNINAFAIAKVLNDIQTVAETKQITFAKALADTAAATELASLNTVKELADLLDTSTDIAAKELTKALADSVTLADVPELLFAALKTEDVTLADQIVKEPGVNSPEDAASTADNSTLAANKGLAEDITLLETVTVVLKKFIVEFFSDLVATSDAQTLDITSQKADNITTSSNGLLVMQDYCDITYFLEDYVGISRTLT